MLKIILLVEDIFTPRDYKRLGVEILRANGFKVEIWDTSPLVHPAPANEYGNHTWSGYHLYRQPHELIRMLRSLGEETLVVCSMGYEYKTYCYFKALSYSRARFCVSWVDGGRALSSKTTIRRKRMSSFRRMKPFELMSDILLNRIPPRWLRLRSAEFALLGGASTPYRRYPVGKKTTLLWAHSYDYDALLEEAKRPLETSDSTAVFLDEYAPLHPDYKVQKLEPPCKPENYYPEINKLFDYVEKEFGLEVVIAAHPHSQYEQRPECFPGRPVIRGETARLVRQSSLVIAHASYSIAFAILWKKPVLFITTEEISQSFLGSFIEDTAKLLEKSSVNISNPFSLDRMSVFALDEAAYFNYRHRFIKREGTKEISSWQIVADYLNQSH